MSNYTKATDFAVKDTLASGNAAKLVKGTEIDDEFNLIETAVNSKANTAGPTFTGTVTMTTLNGATISGGTY
jgi:phosphosulfolactate phosphohydrolase-like enzyme